MPLYLFGTVAVASRNPRNSTVSSSFLLLLAAQTQRLAQNEDGAIFRVAEPAKPQLRSLARPVCPP